MTVQERSTSEPPEGLEEVNHKTGLRGGFPIKINGFALGSQENLNDTPEWFGFKLNSRFGGSGSIPTTNGTAAVSERRRSLRGSTPVKITGVQFVRSPSPTDQSFATPFGAVGGNKNNNRLFQKKSLQGGYGEPKSLSHNNLASTADLYSQRSFPTQVNDNSHSRIDNNSNSINDKSCHSSSLSNYSFDQGLSLLDTNASFTLVLPAVPSNEAKLVPSDESVPMESEGSVGGIGAEVGEVLGQEKSFLSNSTATEKSGDSMYNENEFYSANSVEHTFSSEKTMTTYDLTDKNAETMFCLGKENGLNQHGAMDSKSEADSREPAPVKLQRPSHFRKLSLSDKKYGSLSTLNSEIQGSMFNLNTTGQDARYSSKSELWVDDKITECRLTSPGAAQVSGGHGQCPTEQTVLDQDSDVMSLDSTSQHLKLEPTQEKEENCNAYLSDMTRDSSNYFETYSNQGQFFEAQVYNSKTSGLEIPVASDVVQLCDNVDHSLVLSNDAQTLQPTESSQSLLASTVDISPNKLENAISNMTEKLESFKNEVTEEVRMESVDQALQNMKASLRSLRSETEVSSCSLEDVLSTMKDTLSSIKTEVNHKTLLDLNREMTPFDLPALSPVPQKARARKAKRFNVQEDMRRDRVTNVQIFRTTQGSSEPAVLDGESTSCQPPPTELDPDMPAKGQLENEYNVQADILISNAGNDAFAAAEPEDVGVGNIVDNITLEVENLGLVSNVEVFEKTEEPTNFIPSEHKEKISECLAELDGKMTDQFTPIETNIDASDLEFFHRNEFRRKSSTIERKDVQSDTLCAPSKEYLRDSFTDTELTGGFSHSKHNVTRTSNFTDTETDVASTGGDVTESETAVATSDTDNETTRSNTSQLLDNSSKSSFFMTEFSSDAESFSKHYVFETSNSKASEKRLRNRTIDLHDLPSLFWEGTVKDYHERQYGMSETAVVSEQQVSSTNHTERQEDQDHRVEIAKDGLGLILKRLQNIELKLDELKTIETSILVHDVAAPSKSQLNIEGRRHSFPGRFSSLGDSIHLGNLSTISIDNTNQHDYDLTRTPTGENLLDQEDMKSPEPCSPPETPTPVTAQPARGNVNSSAEAADHYLSDGKSSGCSTPTLLDRKPQEVGYESDDTMCHDSDCEGVIDDKSDEDSNLARWSYKPFGLNISELSDFSSEDEDTESRQQRIENLASALGDRQEVQLVTVPQYRRSELNMDIDTLSERSEEEDEERQRRPQQPRRQSARKRSMSRERNVAKLRYCWRCHHAGHENWQCQEDVQPGGWCPRCLESSHWEDVCWVEQAKVQCPICNIPGHLPCVHQATDFRQRKLVIDTFGWLAFKEWFQDLTFRSWWNCSGYTGVPLYKIMQRNPGQDLDLGFETEPVTKI